MTHSSDKRDSWSRYDHEPTYLYALVASDAPRTIRYVGMTRDPDARFKQHTKNVRHGTIVQEWAREVRERGQSVEMLALGRFETRPEATAREWRIISRLRKRGMCDLNLAKDAGAAFFAMCASPTFRARFDREYTQR